MMAASLENDTVVQFPQSPQDDSAIELSHAIAILNISIRVLNARLLGVFALLGGIGMWACAVAIPDSLRLWAAAGYSLGVLLPTLFLYSRKG